MASPPPYYLLAAIILLAAVSAVRLGIVYPATRPSVSPPASSSSSSSSSTTTTTATTNLYYYFAAMEEEEEKELRLPPLRLKGINRMDIEMRITGRDGVRRTCSAQRSATRRSDDRPRRRQQQFTESSLDEYLTTLRGTCLVHDGGWWVTNVCFRDGIVQAHSEGSRETMRYSLGRYTGMGKVWYSSGSSPSPSSSASEKPPEPLFFEEAYEYGQLCDETGGPRSARVRLYCCRGEDDDDEDENDDGGGESTTAPIEREKSPRLVSLYESPVCSYTISVCSRTACSLGLSRSAGVMGAGEAHASLNALSGLCFQHRERAWRGFVEVLEFCYERHVKRFKVALDPNGINHHKPHSTLAVGGSRDRWRRVFVASGKRAGVPSDAGERREETVLGLHEPGSARLLLHAFVEEKVPGRDREKYRVDLGTQLVHEMETGDVIQVYGGGDPCESGKSATAVRVGCYLTSASPPEIIYARPMVSDMCWTFVLFHAPSFCVSEDGRRRRTRAKKRPSQHDEIGVLTCV